MGLPYARMTAWRRYENTDEYAAEPEWCYHRRMYTDPMTFLQHNLGKFRNDIYNLALSTSPYDDKNTKAIYLYIDGIRIMRVSLKKRLLNIEFRNEDVANAFANSIETLILGRYPLRKKQFEAAYMYDKYVYSKYYYTWPFTRFIRLLDTKKEPESITI